jgi:dTDP-4-dehydrorhamnose 3,5-epimerase-like enzyme
LNDLNTTEIIDFPCVNSKEASLFVYESEKAVPFIVKRVFTISTTESCKRGFHAHKECSQLLVCMQGSCHVILDDGRTRKEVLLNQPNIGLLIPPMIWAEQAYEANTILMVLTDRLYEESDYIRDYDAYLKYRNVK